MERLFLQDKPIWASYTWFMYRTPQIWWITWNTLILVVKVWFLLRTPAFLSEAIIDLMLGAFNTDWFWFIPEIRSQAWKAKSICVLVEAIGTLTLHYWCIKLFDIWAADALFCRFVKISWAGTSYAFSWGFDKRCIAWAYTWECVLIEDISIWAADEATTELTVKALICLDTYHRSEENYQSKDQESFNPHKLI